MTAGATPGTPGTAAPGAAAPGADHGPLAGRRVLVPRGGEWGARVAAMLEARGAAPTVVPLLTFLPPDDVTPLDAAVTRLAAGSYAWLVVTSATTVEALADRAPLVTGVSGGSSTSRTPADDALRTVVGATRVAAVGPGTARALERHRLTAALVPTGERSGAGLVAEMPPAPAGATGPERAVLAPHSDLAEPTVVDGLTALGWAVDDVVAYRTVPGDVTDEVREDVRAGWFDAVLLTSASAVRHLLEQAGTPPGRTLVACIGPRTREAAEAAGLTVHVQPVQASAEELVEALARYVTEERP